MPLRRRTAAALAVAAALTGGAGAAARAADPGWTETGRTTVPVEYYQGVASDPDGRLFFNGVFSGLYRTDPFGRQRRARSNVFPSSVFASEHYNHTGDIAWDRREGGRVLLPTECYYPGTAGAPGDPDPANTCKTGSIGVADPRTLAWRYYVKLDPAEVPKAMWVAVPPYGHLAWTQSGHDLLGYALADISMAHAGPDHGPIHAVRRLTNAVPPPGITGAVFLHRRLFAATSTGRDGRIRVWSIDLATGTRRLEIVKRMADGESEGLDVFAGLGGELHWLVQRNVNGLTPYRAANGLLLHFVERGHTPSTTPRRPARIDLAVTPRHVAPGDSVTLTVTATARLAGRLLPIDQAAIELDGRSAFTDTDGRAKLTFHSSRAGDHLMTAVRQNLRAGSATVVVRKP